MKVQRELQAALSTPALWPFQSRQWGWELAGLAEHAVKAARGFPLISKVTVLAGTVSYSRGSDGSSVSLFFPYCSVHC